MLVVAMRATICAADIIWLPCVRPSVLQTSSTCPAAECLLVDTVGSVTWCAGSEMLLADDIESFWLAGPSSSGTSDQAAAPTQLDRAYSHGSSALSRSASIAHSVGRHPSTSEGQLTPFVL